eukprot:CAMPEP_0116895062 /NCGR_PEP_ID=MMETSP0467-20121206/4671_1 /TAXON_ID=283647 /ORGANISM="Mesodinium pulex, Strain SPMC105" /LENGTH=99 /DNA_ID=CAMNT_0004565587 /DNA_START=913 /DNA_END=1213 /DNA_ORIENTATION=-
MAAAHCGPAGPGRDHQRAGEVRVRVAQASQPLEDEHVPGPPVEQFKKEQLTNIICVGDSNYEIDSAKEMKDYFNTAFLKTVKLKELPHPQELISQLELI